MLDTYNLSTCISKGTYLTDIRVTTSDWIQTTSRRKHEDQKLNTTTK